VGSKRDHLSHVILDQKRRQYLGLSKSLQKTKEWPNTETTGAKRISYSEQNQNLPSSMAETAAVFGVSSSTLPSLSPRTTTRSLTPTTITRSFLASPPSFPYLSLSNSHSQLAVVSSDSKTSQFDLSAPDLDITGGGGDIKGNGDDFGGGGGGGDDSSKGEEGSDGDKRNMALSMSQKLTLGYAILVGGISLSNANTILLLLNPIN